ncbi:MAG TPA: TonB-dependent receptor, partial [Gemmatimonadaceae bacterium]|nr:TonB-dependent receptor [Gemmatimonadaceae bacterium]
EKLRLLSSSVISLNDSTTVTEVPVTTLGNTQLLPERSSELEGGVDAALWHGRLEITYTQYNKTRHNAIVNIPVAPSILPEINTNQEYINVAKIRNTGTEATVNAQLLENRSVSWAVGINLSNDNNLVVNLGNGLSEIDLGNNEFIKPGYPLFSQFARPIVSFADANHDGIIEPNEIRYGDSLVYVGQADPKYQFNIHSTITLLNGRLSMTATFAYQNGMTQENSGAINSGALTSVLNTPGLPLATQAAIVSASCAAGDIKQCSEGIQSLQGQQSPIAGSLIGIIQTVNTFRFSDLSINYTLPNSLAHWFRMSRMSLALQGSNLGLHTNYRGMDPDVNAFATVSTGDETADLGQIPQARVWLLKMIMGN